MVGGVTHRKHSVRNTVKGLRKKEVFKEVVFDFALSRKHFFNTTGKEAVAEPAGSLT